MKRLRLLALCFLVSWAALPFGNWAAHANSKAPASDADGLGGVRFVFVGAKGSQDEAAWADAVKKAGEQAGWTETRVDKPGTITLVPPANYRSKMFDALLKSINKAHLKDFGIQLLNEAGKATDDQGRPIED